MALVMTTTAGALEALGFEEVEPGVVEDTPENRSRVYRLEGGWIYVRVTDEDGMPTGLIRPLSPAQATALRESKYETYRDLLVDPEDAWSDYVGPDDFPLDSAAPGWVLHRLRMWRERALDGRAPEDQRPFPVRCTHIRNDGTRCWMWAGNPQDITLCGAHKRQAGRDVGRITAAAKVKAAELSLDAVDKLGWLIDYGETHAVQLKASTEILDRAGVRGGIEIDSHVEVEVRDPAAEVRARLDRLAQRSQMAAAAERAALEAKAETQSETVQGEVVPNDAE